MNIDQHPFIFRVSKSIHFLSIIAFAWLVIVSYMEPNLILKPYTYLFGDVGFWAILKLIGMRTDTEIAYFVLCNLILFILHVNLAATYAANVDLYEEWQQSKLTPLTELLNKNIWGLFWPYYAMRVFRLRDYHYEEKLKGAIKKLIRDEILIDLPSVILAVVILYPLLYPEVFGSGFSSILGWQLLTPLIFIVFWNQMLSMFVLISTSIKENKEK